MIDSPTPAPPSPARHAPEAGMEVQLSRLRQLLLGTLAGCLVLGVGVYLFLFRQVSMVRKQIGLKKRWRQKTAAAVSGVAEAPAAGTFSVADLVAAKRLADSLGGVKVARKALATLERLS